MSYISRSGFVTCLAFACTTTAFAQPIINLELKPRSSHTFGADNAPDTPKPAQSVLSDIGTLFQPFGDSQYGAATKLYTLKVYGRPDCSSTQCVETIAFKLSIDANVIHAVSSSVTAIREYMVSRKGSPISLSLPFKYWTNKEGDVKQNWIGFQPYLTGRWIPVKTETESANGGSLAGGFTLEWHADFGVSQPSNTDSTTEYPGFLFASASPSLVVPFGDAVKALALSEPDQKVVLGLDIRGGFSFSGKQPVSLSVNATWTPNGFEVSKKSIGISISKTLTP